MALPNEKLTGKMLSRAFLHELDEKIEELAKKHGVSVRTSDEGTKKDMGNMVTRVAYEFDIPK